ncbi:MAG: histidine kinase dimerization/phosphoacceptor domain -containing protein [Flavobacteriales bacterium]|nr:histidine kinase dimerization/phosphoacceptor domain -containing protein [Flavobacteriales bacterium]
MMSLHKFAKSAFGVLMMVLLSSNLIFSQDERKLDSLKTLLKTEENVEKRLITLSNIVRNTLYCQNDTAFAYSNTYLQEAIAANDTSETARGYNLIGMTFSAQGFHESAIENYIKALPIYENLKDTFMTAMMYNNIAASYQFREKYDETLVFYQKALDLFRSIPDREWEASVMFNMAEHYNKMDQQDRAYEIYVDCEKTFAEIGNEDFRGYSLMGIGNTFQEKQRFEEALPYYNKAMEHVDYSYDPLTFSIIHANMCFCFMNLNLLDSADMHCEKSLQIAKESQALKETRDAYWKNMLLAERKGDFKLAYEFSGQHRIYSDSLFSKDKDELILNMLTKYDTEKKEKEIVVKDLALKSSAEQRKFYILAIILAVLILASVAIIAMNKSRTNKKLAEQNALVEKALHEKEFLLKEIHHRVKNNLQVVSSLLNIQSRDITDAKALEAVNESRNRVKSMAIIHQNLYSEENLTGIDVKDYVGKLSSSLFNSYKVDHDRIDFKTDIQNMILDVDTTIPLGLILNELISNALKYAFEGREEGTLLVSLKENDGVLLLVVKDDGIGMSQSEKRADSFGMKMIEAFAQKLGAEWKVKGDNGTEVELSITNYKRSA